MPPSDIASHLKQLLVTEHGSDIRFLVEDIELRAHSLMIAARSSPTLCKMMMMGIKDGGVIPFQIVGYGVRKVSNPIRSGGHTWALACGFVDQGDDHLTRRPSPSRWSETTKTTSSRWSASASTTRTCGRWPAAVWRSDDPNVFSKTRNTWKLTVPDLFRGHEARYVENDRLTILCTVHVLKEELGTAVENKNRFVSVVPSSPTLSQDLTKLIPTDAEEISPCGCVLPPPDVTFVVEHIEIKAHKLVLAMRSPVLIAGLDLHSTTTTTTLGACVVVRIDDMSAATFKAMLRFIYTDELPLKSNINNMPQRACKKKFASRRLVIMARDLMVAADRYRLERLRLMCEKILSESLE
ncbi:hypothetical protein ZWY2020_031999 [Hordeum vulgare]|nr:hypothetical protein ZWY2020_031999 [Hordeum vulgare]